MSLDIKKAETLVLIGDSGLSGTALELEMGWGLSNRAYKSLIYIISARTDIERCPQKCPQTMPA
jgi:hypothetical protein